MHVGKAEASCWYCKFKSQILIMGGKCQCNYVFVSTIKIYEIKIDG